MNAGRAICPPFLYSLYEFGKAVQFSLFAMPWGYPRRASAASNKNREVQKTSLFFTILAEDCRV